MGSKLHMCLTNGWDATIDLQTNAITVRHTTDQGRFGVVASKYTFSQEQIEKELKKLIVDVEGDRYVLINLIGELGHSDSPMAQALYVATCQCGYKHYSLFIQKLLTGITSN